MKTIITIIVLAALVYGGWYMYQHKGTTAETPAGEAANPAGSTYPAGTPEGQMEDGVVSTGLSADVSTGTVKEFTVSAGSYFFSPKTMTVNKGDTVKITVTNSGGFHDFKIDEFNVSTSRLQSGQSETITFVADKAGTFQYYCSVGDHRAMGMWGTLTVN